MTHDGHTPASLRVRLNLTQAQLAEKATEALRAATGDPDAAVSVSTVMRLERAKNVGTDHARAIATALDVTLDDLLAAVDVVRARLVVSRGKPSRRRRAKGAA